MQKNYVFTGLLDKHGIEVKVGDILRSRYGGDLIVDPFGKYVIGAFTYHPKGAINNTSHYLISDLKDRDFEIVEPAHRQIQMKLDESSYKRLIKSFNLVKTEEDMVSLLNILKANQVSVIDLLITSSENKSVFCGIQLSDHSNEGIVKILFENFKFFTTKKEMDEYVGENASYNGISLDEQYQLEEIIRTEEGYVLSLKC